MESRGLRNAGRHANQHRTLGRRAPAIATAPLRHGLATTLTKARVVTRVFASPGVRGSLKRSAAVEHHCEFLCAGAAGRVLVGTRVRSVRNAGRVMREVALGDAAPRTERGVCIEEDFVDID